MSECSVTPTFDISFTQSVPPDPKAPRFKSSGPIFVPLRKFETSVLNPLYSSAVNPSNKSVI
jgi:hypothetical protein